MADDSRDSGNGENRLPGGKSVIAEARGLYRMLGVGSTVAELREELPYPRRLSEYCWPLPGPTVDVAVISKGDGFVWIKRKHYFSKDFNPHFLATYYREESES